MTSDNKADGVAVSDPFTEGDLQGAEQHPTLGPEYFAARRVMDRFMSSWTEEHLEPLAEEITKAVTEKIRDKVWDDFRDYLLIDTELNAQSEIRSMVSGTVEALMSGKEWAMRRYPLAEGYDSHGIREAVAKHVGDKVAAARIADLEAEVKRLKDNLSYRSGGY